MKESRVFIAHRLGMKMKERNGFFELNHKEDGTYIILHPAIGGGEALTYNMVAEYLMQKKITEYDLKILAKEISELIEEKEIRLNGKTIYPENECLDIRMDESHLKAIGTFYAPSLKGNKMSKQDIMSELVHVGIKCGVNENNIDDFLKERRYCTEIILAESILPVQGKSAEINYTFKVEDFGKPKMNEDGSVDFHQLNMINMVEAGDILATLTPADYGKPGLDIFGKVIRPGKVVAKILRHGGNIHLSEDKLIMYSDVSGHVTLIEDRVFVSDTYEVPADVSVASGDIDYNGNVLVRGNVVTGFTVKAKGDIVVEGVVEGGTLIAEGQIILKRGIQGMGRGKLISNGNVTARFIENCEVKSGGDITTDAIMHSQVCAKGKILVTGKKSIITGGKVKSGKEIVSKVIGSNMCTKTIVSIGVDEDVLKEYKDLEKEIEEMKANQKKLSQIFILFKKRIESGNELTNDQKKQFITAKQEFTKKQEMLDQKEKRQGTLKAEIDGFKAGKIKFMENVYPGVQVVISSSSMYVKEEISHGQFVLDRADIRILSI